MKRYNIILTAVFFLAGLNACDERFEEINTNPNGVADVDPSHLFAKAARDSFRSGISGYDYRIGGQMSHFYVGVFVERFIDKYNQDLSGETYESLFGTGYENLLRYYNEIMMLTAPGMEKEHEFQYAVADVMAVLAYAKMTDAFGDIPYFEGGFGNSGELSPEYDRQRDIYLDMIDRLAKDIETLKTADSSVGLFDQDPVFQDDPDRWLRFTNSLRLRLAMRMRHVEPQIAGGIITECLAEPLMTSNFHNAILVSVDGDNSELFSPWYGVFDFYNFRISDKVVSQLGSTNDPRLPIYATPLSNGSYRGFVNGLTDEYFVDAIDEEHSYPGEYLVGRGAPVFLMTAAEIAFLRAECALFGLGGSDANAHYRNGIELTMQRVGVSQEDIDAFKATETATLSGTPEEQFEQIGTQLWLSFAPNMAEAYASMRRTGYPVVEDRDGIITDKGDTEGELPSRIIYPLSEKLRNSDNVNAAIENMGGEDVLKTRVWWDVRR
ncbi:MAG: SusD/RagB family nutrient-binding outer membrane lipoprotein [Cytophagales bacterium]|nr:SusD/RagB family nutrient-binding outer membrane lipoprotein [Cytophagales bacterium]